VTATRVPSGEVARRREAGRLARDLAVVCPKCGAGSLELCRSRRGRVAQRAHRDRADAARLLRAEAKA
jgi:hypothetical protein